jgi:hypothetical protein
MGSCMSGDVDPLGQIKVFIDRQDNEATLHWARNSYFLVGISFLVVAYGLSLQSTSGAIDWFHGLIILLGIVLGSLWFLIQFRSDQYIGYYKSKVGELCEKYGVDNPYPVGLRGIQTRKVAYGLPAIFLVFWIGLLIVLIVSH